MPRVDVFCNRGLLILPALFRSACAPKLVCQTLQDISSFLSGWERNREHHALKQYIYIFPTYIRAMERNIASEVD
jgi:hypothetical protein